MTETAFYTATMAKVYADQGHHEKAVEIYRHLLKQDPGRRDLQEALFALEQKMKESRTKTPRDLTGLVQRWIELLLHSRNLRKLKKL